MTETQTVRDEKGQFVVGHIGLGGRPRGSRNKLGEAFLADLYEDWKTHGVGALKECRETNPAAYVKVVASLLPQQLEIKDGSFDGITDEQLAALIAVARDAIGVREPAAEGTAAPVH